MFASFASATFKVQFLKEIWFRSKTPVEGEIQGRSQGPASAGEEEARFWSHSCPNRVHSSPYLMFDIWYSMFYFWFLIVALPKARVSSPYFGQTPLEFHLICIWIFICCQHTKKKDIAGYSARSRGGWVGFRWARGWLVGNTSLCLTSSTVQSPHLNISFQSFVKFVKKNNHQYKWKKQL